MNNWVLYIVDKKGHYYVGITTDLANRLRQHGHPALLYASHAMARNEAVTMERTVKGWSRAKKEALIKASSKAGE